MTKIIKAGVVGCGRNCKRKAFSRNQEKTERSSWLHL